jgi:hypothetical protein
LLVEKGEAILELLSDIKYLGVLNIPFIDYLVKLQWKTVQNAIKLKTLYPFFGLLIFFTIYTMWFVSYVDDLPSLTSDSGYLHSFCYYVLILL